MNKVFDMSSINYEENEKLSCIDCVFHTIQELGAEIPMSIQDPFIFK